MRLYPEIQKFIFGVLCNKYVPIVLFLDLTFDMLADPNDLSVLGIWNKIAVLLFWIALHLSIAAFLLPVLFYYQSRNGGNRLYLSIFACSLLATTLAVLIHFLIMRSVTPIEDSFQFIVFSFISQFVRNTLVWLLLYFIYRPQLLRVIAANREDPEISVPPQEYTNNTPCVRAPCAECADTISDAEAGTSFEHEVLKGALVLQAEGNYTRVLTGDGEHLLRMPFWNATKNVKGAGIKTHRSYWLRTDLIEELVYENGKPMILTTCDRLIPISRGMIGDVKSVVDMRHAEKQSESYQI